MDGQSQLQKFVIHLLTSQMNKKHVGLTKQGVICFQVFVVADKPNTPKLFNESTANNGFVLYRKL